MEKLIKHRAEDARPVGTLRPDVPAELAAVVHKLLSKRPEDRFRTPAEVAEALAPFTHGDDAGRAGVAMDMVPATVAATVAVAVVPAANLDAGAPGSPATPRVPKPAALKTSSRRWLKAASFLWRPRDDAKRGRWIAILGAGGLLTVGLAAVLVVLMNRPVQTSRPASEGTESRIGPPALPAATVQIEANKPWQDTGVDVQVNMAIMVRSKGEWKSGPDAAACSADGHGSDDRRFLSDANAMCLLGRVGNSETLVVLGKDKTVFVKETGRLFVQCNDLELEDNTGTLTLEIQGGTQKKDAAPPPPLTRVQLAGIGLKQLLGKVADRTADADTSWQEVLAFRVQYAGTPYAIRAGELLLKLPSPLDQLDPAKLPEDAKVAWRAASVSLPVQPVAVLGEHRGRHWAPASCVAYSPDGKFLASGGQDNVIRVWDAATLDQRAVFPAAAAYCLRFSPDGTRILTGGPDMEIRLWDAASGKELRQFPGHHNYVYGVAFSADGTLALSGAHSNVYLWDLETGKLLHNFKGHTYYVYGVAFLPDQKHAVSCGDDTVRIWDLEAGKELRSFKVSGPVRDLDLLPSGRQALAGVYARVVLLDLETGAEKHVFEGHTKNVWTVACSGDGRWAASGGEDGSVRIWDLEKRKAVHCLERHTALVMDVAFSPDSKRVASASLDGTVRVWDVETGKEVQPLAESPGIVNSVAFSPDCRTIAIGGSDHTVRLWDMAATREMRNFRGHNGSVHVVRFAPDGQTLASGNDDGAVTLWELATGQLLATFQTPRVVWTLAFAPDARTLATAGFTGGGSRDNSSDRTVRLWSLTQAKPKPLFVLESHEEGILTVAFSPDGNTLVSGSHDGTVRLWDMSTRREQSPGRKLVDHVNSLSYSPDGRMLAGAGYHGHVSLWDVTKEQQVFGDRPHLGNTRVRVAYSPDGKNLVSAGWDGRIFQWEVPSGKKLQEWQLPGPIHDITFVADGRHFATANGNGTVYIFRLAPAPQWPPP